ncbi:hypothetical protein LOX54_09150 [Latilactobacillus curvatus]|uniref:hypothetical protein n=1 Tax=Latilactobacillus curvatus TaxID=28038 RepID=UPI0020C79318|nr:hypothetical protein [Latilactobacillus curvatus]MCP8861658.1 hypothetical protein [Latilactobacillus curvatus]MCP8869236.1 hypothetical protein [Latilactobacillus curvatus]MCP8872778.1 hypothetical protein [Latilactobacillus curvatus]MCP8881808.1 hypothetical protein [Latilactobacillus curvatus]MCS6143125.1 hypothetical protein [Latilactobacillus curvatus]
MIQTDLQTQINSLPESDQVVIKQLLSEIENKNINNKQIRDHISNKIIQIVQEDLNTGESDYANY